jgi:hypothetical protein
MYISNTRKNAQKLVDHGEAPFYLLGPLQALLQATMHERDEERLLRQGVSAVNRFFGEWKTISKLFFETRPDGTIEHTVLFNEKLVVAAWWKLTETYDGSIPAPIYRIRICPGKLGEKCKRILDKNNGSHCTDCAKSLVWGA